MTQAAIEDKSSHAKRYAQSHAKQEGQRIFDSLNTYQTNMSATFIQSWDDFQTLANTEIQNVKTFGEHNERLITTMTENFMPEADLKTVQLKKQQDEMKSIISPIVNKAIEQKIKELEQNNNVTNAGPEPSPSKPKVKILSREEHMSQYNEKNFGTQDIKEDTHSASSPKYSNNIRESRRKHHTST